jgi:glucokinase
VPDLLHVAVDVGGTKIMVGAAAEDLRWRDVVTFPTPGTYPLDDVLAIVDRVAGGAQVAGLALAMPGPLRRDTGAALAAPNIAGAWRTRPLADDLRRRTGMPVVVENDANCAALAEALHGAGRRHRTVVYYTVSTGIGCGVVHDGVVVTGRDDVEAGHHVVWPAWLGGPRCGCGSRGCLEAVASGTALRARYGVEASRLDDAAAWADVGRWLGIGVVNAVMFHDPDVVVIGGGLTGAWDRWAPSLRATLSETLRLRPAPPVVRAELSERAALSGALLLSLRHHGG